MSPSKHTRANAVYNVTGKRARDLSILPEEILAATADIDSRVMNKPMFSCI